MLFNSYIFIFLFLPITLLGLYLIGSRGYNRTATGWLVIASLFFYGWWNPAYLCLILVSIIFNYVIGIPIGKPELKFRKSLLLLGIAFNLSLIAYFKYANFFIDTVNRIFESSYHLETIILPLAISFFTFQQIAFLVDTYKGKVKENDFLNYCLFVTFFPQLIAGPIVHHKEMMPQFAKNLIHYFKYENLSVGLTIFIIGLFKKVVLADGVAIYATPVFEAAEQGVTLGLFEAWGGALAYTLQLYFDFSGYSDMAIGIARMFGILLPLNFNSPYKSTNIIEFWQQWHITLSRFLKNYVYIPLGGNRKGSTRRFINLFLTMLLGGLWHGAAWTFVIWGGLHGFYLIVNHIWHIVRRMLWNTTDRVAWYWTSVARIITFIAIVISWVIFRAESLNGAVNMLFSMFTIRGVSFSMRIDKNISWIENYNYMIDRLFYNNLVDWSVGVVTILFLLILVFFAPNTQQIMSNYKPTLSLITENNYKWLKWGPSIKYAVVLLIIAYWSFSSLTKVSEFLYFNF